MQTALFLLVQDLKWYGPAPGKQWPNYSKLAQAGKCDKRHCHLIKGNPIHKEQIPTVGCNIKWK